MVAVYKMSARGRKIKAVKRCKRKVCRIDKLLDCRTLNLATFYPFSHEPVITPTY